MPRHRWRCGGDAAVNVLARRPLTLLVGLFLVLIVGVVLAPTPSEPQPPLTVYSAAPSGGKALRLWLEALGYRVSTIDGESYAIPRDTGTVLLLAPTESVTSDEVATLEAWTRDGGRLVVADAGNRTASLLQRFGVRVGDLAPTSTTWPCQTPNVRLDPQIVPI